MSNITAGQPSRIFRGAYLQGVGRLYSPSLLEVVFSESYISEAGPAVLWRLTRMRCQAGSALGTQMNLSSLKRDNLRRCVIDNTDLGNLAVPEGVDVHPLLLKRAAR